MMAILHGKVKPSPRGTPPKSVAAKYTAPGKDAPEQHGENRGGHWGEEHHARAKEKVKSDRIKRKKKKKDLKKSFEDFYKGKGAGVIVVDDSGKVLIGKQNDMGVWATPGGHLEPTETHDEAALRELREETGLVGSNPIELGGGRYNGNDSKVFLVNDFKGKPRDTAEISNLKFVDVQDIPWGQMRDCSAHGLKLFLQHRLNKSKSLKDMLALETLEKNISRGIDGFALEVTHGDALRLVGNGAFRFLRNAVKDMKDEDFKDVTLDNHIISIRKHLNDVYSGRVSDGHKVIYQFTNKSLPELTAAIMSLFEWYLPEDEKELHILDEANMDDDVIHGGLNQLIDNYKKHNISNIYQEMETIRSEIRNGMAVDLQQVEARIMKLFDKMENFVQDMAGKHNKLVQDAGAELEKLEAKLREMQSKLEELAKKPETVMGYSSNPANSAKVHNDFYSYLPRPAVEISPDGRIKITFSEHWTDLEKDNFLSDMRTKVVKRAE